MQDTTTENKIMNAAATLFTQKGYTATRMRDIATEADVNLALINYYYKSKENLFSIVMREKIKQLFGTIVPCLSNEDIPLDEKINITVEELYKVISTDKNLPMFVFSELQKDDAEFLKILPAEEIENSSFADQLADTQPGTHPYHYVLNLFALVLFPYIMMPLLTKVGSLPAKDVRSILRERVKLIPRWMKQTLYLE